MFDWGLSAPRFDPWTTSRSMSSFLQPHLPYKAFSYLDTCPSWDLSSCQYSGGPPFGLPARVPRACTSWKSWGITSVWLCTQSNPKSATISLIFVWLEINLSWIISIYRSNQSKSLSHVCKLVSIRNNHNVRWQYLLFNSEKGGRLTSRAMP